MLIELRNQIYQFNLYSINRESEISDKSIFNKLRIRIMLIELRNQINQFNLYSINRESEISD